SAARFPLANPPPDSKANTRPAPPSRLRGLGAGRSHFAVLLLSSRSPPPKNSQRQRKSHDSPHAEDAELAGDALQRRPLEDDAAQRVVEGGKRQRPDVGLHRGGKIRGRKEVAAYEPHRH